MLNLPPNVPLFEIKKKSKKKRKIIKIFEKMFVKYSLSLQKAKSKIFHSLKGEPLPEVKINNAKNYGKNKNFG